MPHLDSTRKLLSLLGVVVTRGLLDRFDTDAWAALNVYPVVGGVAIDPEYGYAFSNPEPVNKYVTTQVTRNADGIHPVPVGLYQQGDYEAAGIQATR